MIKSEFNSYTKYAIKLFIVTLIYFLSISDEANSQGFDWQKGGRLPYQIPVFYFGVNTAYNLNLHNGEFNFQEDFIECCKFSTGNGAGFSIGFTGEYWYKPELAFSISLSYSQNNGDFEVQSILPTRDGDFITNYGYKSSIKNVNFDLSARHRISNSHFSFGAGLRFAAYISGTNEYTEQAITNNVPFEKRVIVNGMIKDTNPIIISPILFIAYDAPLGIGYYATPNISISYNANSIIEDEAWRMLSISLGVRILKSF